jgi:hypothetical protein
MASLPHDAGAMEARKVLSGGKRGWTWTHYLVPVLGPADRLHPVQALANHSHFDIMQFAGWQGPNVFRSITAKRVHYAARRSSSVTARGAREAMVVAG